MRQVGRWVREHFLPRMRFFPVARGIKCPKCNHNAFKMAASMGFKEGFTMGLDQLDQLLATSLT